MDVFTYLRRNISSTESDVNIRLEKAWKAVGTLLITWKSDLSDEIKQDFFQDVAVAILLHVYTTWALTKCIEKKLDGELRKNVACGLEQILETTTHKTAAV